ncbi:MAG: cation diffusion facilitator family transporter [Cyanobacteria bacterium REEB65]|nr:cation diffusion facilitator family transporter [Cyanobacteria bacterium REEB65]
MIDATARKSKRLAASVISVCSNLVLTTLKLGVGLQTGSMSVLSEAVHSAVDLLASALTFLAIRAAAKPADADHTYGHGKYENLSSLAEGALILAAGLLIAWEASQRLFGQTAVPQVNFGMAAIAASCVLNLIVAAYLHRVARSEDSPALGAEADHLSSDVVTGTGVLVGLALVKITHQARFDSLTALGVAAWILWIGGRLVARALATLADHSLPADEVAAIEAVLRSFEHRLVEWHGLRTRRSGSQRHIDVHLVVAGDITARSAHDIADDLERALMACFPGAVVMTHVDVADRLPDGQIVVSD